MKSHILVTSANELLLIRKLSKITKKHAPNIFSQFWTNHWHKTQILLINWNNSNKLNELLVYLFIIVQVSEFVKAAKVSGKVIRRSILEKSVEGMTSFFIRIFR